jgi:hypothetical protein
MAERLKRVLPEIVFVGGCTTVPLITDPAASPVRAKEDADVIVEVALTLNMRVSPSAFATSAFPKTNPRVHQSADG